MNASSNTIYIHNPVNVPTGGVFGDSWKHQITQFQASSSNSEAAMQYVLPWFYTCRLDVPFDAVAAALELCQQAQLTELVAEADLTLNSEGTCFVSSEEPETSYLAFPLLTLGVMLSIVLRHSCRSSNSAFAMTISVILLSIVLGYGRLWLPALPNNSLLVFDNCYLPSWLSMTVLSDTSILTRCVFGCLHTVMPIVRHPSVHDLTITNCQ